VQQALNLAERKRRSNVHHHRQADDLRVAAKAFERVAFYHEDWLREHFAGLISNPSDRT